MSEKRTVAKTVHFEPSVAEALELARQHEQRTFSSLVSLVVKKDPTIQLFLQKIGRQVGNQ